MKRITTLPDHQLRWFRHRILIMLFLLSSTATTESSEPDATQQKVTNQTKQSAPNTRPEPRRQWIKADFVSRRAMGALWKAFQSQKQQPVDLSTDLGATFNRDVVRHFILSDSRIAVRQGAYRKLDQVHLKRAFSREKHFQHYEPLMLTVGVVAHSRLEINELKLNQLSEIVSGNVKNWQNFGPKISKPITIIGQSTRTSSGVIVWKKCLFRNARLRKDMVEKHRMAEVLQQVRKTPGAIGFFLHPTPGDNAVIEKTKGVRLLKIAPCDTTGKPAGPAVLPTIETLSQGTYPLTDPLVMILHPDAPPEAEQFVKFVQSEQGARIAYEQAHKQYPSSSYDKLVMQHLKTVNDKLKEQSSPSNSQSPKKGN